MERELADFKGTADAITFSSGYLANLAVSPRCFRRRTASSSIPCPTAAWWTPAALPASRCSASSTTIHARCKQELESGAPANRTLIIADGVFSMDGDICRLPELVELKQQFHCYLMIDESHATGVLGSHGRGTDEHFGIDTSDVDIWTGSLAKAIPSNGGFACVSQELAIYLQHAAAPFIFSAALCPAAVAAVRETLAILRSEPERVHPPERERGFPARRPAGTRLRHRHLGDRRLFR